MLTPKVDVISVLTVQLPLLPTVYDQRSDPHQLHNLFYLSSAEGGVSAGVKQELHDRLRRAWACRGETCG